MLKDKPPTREELRRRVLEIVDAENLEGPELCDAYIKASLLVRYDNPELMIDLAKQAVDLAGFLDPQEYGAKKAADCRCRAKIELGNAHRVADQLDKAASALGDATVLWPQGSRDELLKARMFDCQATLSAARRDFPNASLALDTVHAIYAKVGDTHRAGRALISKGIYCGYAGDYEQAIQLLKNGLEQIDHPRDPELAAAAVQSQVSFLVLSGRFLEARQLLQGYRFPADMLAARINQLKIRWVEAEIEAGLGDAEQAEEGLLEVMRGFGEEGLFYKGALAGLDLVQLWYRQGRRQEVRQVVGELLQIFLTYRINREALLSLNLLESALEHGTENEATLAQVTEFMRRAETQPGMKYSDWFPG